VGAEFIGGAINTHGETVPYDSHRTNFAVTVEI